MKAMICVCLFALIAAVMAAPNEKYTSKYNNINLDEILHNPRLYNGYIDCCLDLGPCTAEGKELKSHIAEALQENCARCTEEHRERIEKVIKFIINEKSGDWERLCNKYDPQRKYTHKYEEQLKKVQS